MILPIKYRLYNGYLEVRWGKDEIWKRVRPTNSKRLTPITQRYGKDFKWRKSEPKEWFDRWFYSDILGKPDGHSGIDLEAPIGACLYAPEDGEITEVKETSGAGKKVKMKGATGIHVFCHLSEFIVAVGSKVKKGEMIALTGNSGGYTTAPHLHWGIKDGKYFNFESLLDFEIFILPYRDGMFIQRTDVANGGHGEVYEIVDGELQYCDTKSNPAVDVNHLIHKVLRLLKDGIEPKSIESISESDFLKFNQLIK